MLHETITSLPPADVLARAREFFAERVPQQGAFLEKEGPGFATFRGQGGEEIALAVFANAGGTRVRASTLLFDQSVGRFLSTLPAAGAPDGP
jgi:hypothetical protein